MNGKPKNLPELSIIIPCLNEQDNLWELARRILKVFKAKKIIGEIIFINDGSTDSTIEVLREIKQKYKEISLVNNKKNLGIATSCKLGLEKAEGKYVCLIDADLQYQPEDIYRLYREIKWTAADLVQGARTHIGRQDKLRFFLSVVLNFFLNTLFGMNSKDNKSVFITCRKEVLVDILGTNWRFKYKYFLTYITIVAKTKGYSIREIEVLFEKRMAGESFMEKALLKVIIFVLLDTVKAFIEFHFLDRYDNILHEFAKKAPSRIEKNTEQWRKVLFWLYRQTMPIHHWMINKAAFRYYTDLKKTQWLSREDLEKLQLAKLKRIINQAYYHVPYYRERFDQLKLKPEDVKTLGDIRKLPYLSKDDIRSNLFFSLFSDNYNKKNILRITTSGSTGEPLVLFVDKEQLNLRFASTLRGMGWAGYRFGDKQIRLWHQTIGMNKIQVIREKIDAFLCRRMFIPAYKMNLENIDEIIGKIKRYKPTFMDGYAESLNLIAQYCKTRKVKDVKVRGIISSAQTLPKTSREIIERYLRTKVYDKYGSREFSGIAYQCEARDGYHVTAESYIVEIIKNNRPARAGGIGEVVITDVTNMCMPIIRYRIGDLAGVVDNSKPCICGRNLPRIEGIKGRIQAMIIGKNGQLVPGTFFAHLLKDYWFAIKQFQVVQNKIGEIELKVIKGGRYSDILLEKIVREMKEYVGEDTKVNIQFVEAIPLGQTGKYYHSISNLNLDIQKLKF